MRSKNNTWFILAVFLTGLWSCKKWNDHVAVTEQALNMNLMEQINSNPNLSKFSEYLVKTGLDKEISSSKSYTVFAPTNDALQVLTPDVIADTAKLKTYLLNHIAGQLYFTQLAKDTVRVLMMNGKRVSLLNKIFDDATITQADVYVRNGVLQVINKVIPPLPNIWEFVQSTKTSYDQNAYVSSLNYLAQDPTKAVVDSINPATGQLVYKPNTGIVQVNTFLSKVYDVSNEDSLYTYVLLNNTAFAAEVAKQKPYFQSSVAANVTANASWNASKDFVIKGLYSPDKLPAALLSKFNVHVNMNKAAIIETRKVSNGIVYIMSDATSPIAEKIPTVIIQGETPDSLSSYSSSYTVKIFYRQRNNPLISQPFKDIYFSLGSIGPNFYADYTTNSLYTTKYKVYWVALNDKVISGQADDPYGTDSTLQQMLKIGPYSVNPFVPTFNVQMGVKPYQYNEVYLGDYTNTSYDFLLSYPLRLPDGSVYTYNAATRRIRLQAPASGTLTGIPYNMTLDYIKFVPY